MYPVQCSPTVDSKRVCTSHSRRMDPPRGYGTDRWMDRTRPWRPSQRLGRTQEPQATHGVTTDTHGKRDPFQSSPSRLGHGGPPERHPPQADPSRNMSTPLPPDTPRDAPPNKSTHPLRCMSCGVPPVHTQASTASVTPRRTNHIKCTSPNGETIIMCDGPQRHNTCGSLPAMCISPDRPTRHHVVSP